MATDEDITALAEILSPAVEVPPLPELPSGSRPHFGRSNSNPVNTDVHFIRPRTSTSAMSFTSTISASSDQSLPPDSEVSEGYYDSAYLSASPTTTSFHLPRIRQRYLSDTPSLATSESHSIASLSTPPLSRASSFQLAYGSPPTSPVSYLPTPTDCSIPGLGVIHERNQYEDEQIHTRLERALTFDDVIPREAASRKEKQAAPTTTEPPRTSSRPASPQTIVPPAPSVWSTEGSISSGTPSSHSSHHGRSSKGFSKLFSKSKSGDGMSSPVFSDKSLEKAAKEEEKRIKKQQAKERRERLALQFQHQAMMKAAAAESKSIGSDGSSAKRKMRNWEEEQGMYEGLTL